MDNLFETSKYRNMDNYIETDEVYTICNLYFIMN